MRSRWKVDVAALAYGIYLSVFRSLIPFVLSFPCPPPPVPFRYLFSLLVSCFVNITCHETSAEFMFGLVAA